MLRPSPAVNGKEEDMYLGKFRRKELGRDANPSVLQKDFLRYFAAKPFAQEVASLHRRTPSVSSRRSQTGMASFRLFP